MPSEQITIALWFTDWWPQGKTSNTSRFNIPGKIGWMTMEVPAFLTLLYIMWALPAELGREEPLPKENWVMASMFVRVQSLVVGKCAAHLTSDDTLHLSSYHQPSAEPEHVSNPSFHLVLRRVFSDYQRLVAGWLACWIRSFVGIRLVGPLRLHRGGHDADDLREIRRAAARNEERRVAAQGESKGKGERKSVDKVYMMPQNFLFQSVLFPHYLCEWIEWTGFYMVGGLACVPARIFLVNLVTEMGPRALAGRRWYIERFGKDQVGSRKAIIPWLV